ncbi:hypothetical protein G9A89_010537 [Geosiphon pyriformis]|nr:hypothetical protein G9A89_010537 [Geosiphon pyriformis]
MSGRKNQFDYSESDVLADGNPNQMPKKLGVKTKKALDKPLKKIDFLSHNNNNNIFSDVPLELPPPLKNLVNVFVRKSFALDIGLDKIVDKTSQEKCAIVKKLFLGINGFKKVSTPSKFSEIIRVTFTFELSLMKATKKATGAKIMVNTNLKKSNGYFNQTVVLKKIPIDTFIEAVHAVLSKFGIIKSIKIQLVGLWQKAVVEFEQVDYTDLVIAEWSILIKKDTVHVTKTNQDKVS